MAGLRLQIEIPSDNYLFFFPRTSYDSGYNGTFDWGDGQSFSFTSQPSSTDLRHTYATAGTYVIEITGGFPDLNWNEHDGDSSFPDSDLLTAILNFGDPVDFDGIRQLSFYGCSNLVSMPATGHFQKNGMLFLGGFGNGLFRDCSSLTNISADFFDTWSAGDIENLDRVFEGCSSLTSIPDGCFDPFKNDLESAFLAFAFTGITSVYDGVFSNCPLLNDIGSCFLSTPITEVPNNFITNTPNIESITGLFRNTAITSIPAGLFDSQSNIESAILAFAFTEIENIPDGLFDNFTQCTNFYGCFRNTNIASVPEGLFDPCDSCLDFGAVFSNCENLVLNEHIFFGPEGDPNYVHDKNTRFLDQTINWEDTFNRDAAPAVLGKAPELWNCDYGTGGQENNLSSCFEGNGNNVNTLSNYAFIPTTWGGTIGIDLTAEITRVDSTSFNVQITGSYAQTFGIIAKEDGNDFYSSAGSSHTVPVSDDGTDRNFVVEIYYMDGATQNIAVTYDYEHYYIDQVNVQTITVLPENSTGNLVIGNVGDIGAYRIHGDAIDDTYYYGSPRAKDISGLYPCAFVRVNLNDYSLWDLLEVVHPTPGKQFISFEAIHSTDTHLFAQGKETPIEGDPSVGTWIVMIEKATWTYRAFQIMEPSNSQPIGGDENHIYVTLNDGTHKIDVNVFINASGGQYVSNFETQIPTWGQPNYFYDPITQGSNSPNRVPYGVLHSTVNDAEYLYLSYTTSGGFGEYEFHCVKKSDMSSYGWCFIPKSTDDMTQDANWLYFGIEVTPVEDDGSLMGWGWGAYAIEKSVIRGLNIDESPYVDPVKGLPKLHETDNPPYVSSYASLIFGNYLLDFKTNKKLYVLDITDPNSWDPNLNVGSHTTHVFEWNPSGKIKNEAKLDANGWLHSFGWGSPSEAVKYQVPGLSFFAPPTIEYLSTLKNFDEATFRASILNDNGKDVTEYGFEWGDSMDPQTWTNSIAITLDGNQFEHTAQVGYGTVYFRAYAINSEGTGYTEVFSETLVQEIVNPTVQTQAAQINGEDVTLSGQVMDTGGENPSEVGFNWGTESGNLTNNVISNGNPFSQVVTFSPGTYYFQAYAVNSNGTGVGNELSFEVAQTVVAPSVTTAIPVVVDNGVTLNGSIGSDGGAPITDRGFYWGLDPIPATKVSGLTGDNFSHVLSQLSNDTYYFQAYATNSEGESVGTVESFIIDYTAPTNPDPDPNPIYVDDDEKQYIELTTKNLYDVLPTLGVKPKRWYSPLMNKIKEYFLGQTIVLAGRFMSRDTFEPEDPQGVVTFHIKDPEGNHSTVTGNKLTDGVYVANQNVSLIGIHDIAMVLEDGTIVSEKFNVVDSPAIPQS